MKNEEYYFEAENPESLISFQERTGGGIEEYTSALTHYRQSLIQKNSETELHYKQPKLVSGILFDVEVEDIMNG